MKYTDFRELSTITDHKVRYATRDRLFQELREASKDLEHLCVTPETFLELRKCNLLDIYPTEIRDQRKDLYLWENKAITVRNNAPTTPAEIVAFSGKLPAPVAYDKHKQWLNSPVNPEEIIGWIAYNFDSTVDDVEELDRKLNQLGIRTLNKLSSFIRAERDSACALAVSKYSSLTNREFEKLKYDL